MRLTENDRDIAAQMLDEMRTMRLHVFKAESTPNCIRKTATHNPDWYSRMCEAEKRSRKGRNGHRMRARTIVKRCHTLHCLCQIVAGENPDGLYGQRVAEAIKWYADTRGIER